MVTLSARAVARRRIVVEGIVQDTGFRLFADRQAQRRGLGFITHSALKLRPEFAAWDAELRYDVPGICVAGPKACQCGEVLKGVIKPWECKVFGAACTPETPIGTCMVSPEGACAAYFNYGRFSMAAERDKLRVIELKG